MVIAIFLVLLITVQHVFADGGFCSPNLRGDQYFTLTTSNATISKPFIQSPNYPNSYPNNIDCIWKITAPPGKKVKLTITRMMVESRSACTADYIELRNGLYSYSSRIDRFCGSNPPSARYSSGRYMWVKFHSDESYTYSGFRANYEAVEHGQNPADNSHQGGGSSSNRNRNTSTGSSSSGGSIGGSIFGFIFLIALILIVRWWWRRRRRPAIIVREVVKPAAATTVVVQNNMNVNQQAAAPPPPPQQQHPQAMINPGYYPPPQQGYAPPHGYAYPPPPQGAPQPPPPQGYPHPPAPQGYPHPPPPQGPNAPPPPYCAAPIKQ